MEGLKRWQADRVVLATAMIILVVVLAAGWMLMANRINTRTRTAIAEGRMAASRIWGGSVVQESPTVTRLSDGTPVAIVSAAGQARIGMDYRKRGLVYLTGFIADFDMTYSFANSQPVSSAMLFTFPFPKNGELFTNISATDEAGQPVATEVSPDGLKWACPVAPGATRGIKVTYRIRGMDNYIYRLPKGQVMNGFDFTAAVSTTKGIDYPSATMAPTSTEALKDGTPALHWKFSNLVSNFDVGLVLPVYPDYAHDLVRLNLFAPIMLVGLLGVIILSLGLKGYELDPLSMVLIGLTFFLVFPLAAYLMTFTGLVPAYLIAATTGAVCILVFMARFYGVRAALGMGLVASLLFLGFFPYAVMAERLTGLMVTIGGFVLIITLMELYLSTRGTAGEAPAMYPPGLDQVQPSTWNP